MSQRGFASTADHSSVASGFLRKKQVGLDRAPLERVSRVSCARMRGNGLSRGEGDQGIHPVLQESMPLNQTTFNRITQNPDVLAGRATVRGLRISVAHIVDPRGQRHDAATNR